MTADFWWTQPGVDFAKVTYQALEGYVSKAYIDLNTGCGDDKYTDEPVYVVWDDDLDTWVEKEKPDA